MQHSHSNSTESMKKCRTPWCVLYSLIHLTRNATATWGQPHCGIAWSTMIWPAFAQREGSNLAFWWKHSRYAVSSPTTLCKCLGHAKGTIQMQWVSAAFTLTTLSSHSWMVGICDKESWDWGDLATINSIGLCSEGLGTLATFFPFTCFPGKMLLLQKQTSSRWCYDYTFVLQPFKTNVHRQLLASSEHYIRIQLGHVRMACGLHSNAYVALRMLWECLHKAIVGFLSENFTAVKWQSDKFNNIKLWQLQCCYVWPGLNFYQLPIFANISHQQMQVVTRVPLSGCKHSAVWCYDQY